MFAVALGSVYSSIQSILMVVVILLSLGVYRVAYKKKGNLDGTERNGEHDCQRHGKRGHLYIFQHNRDHHRAHQSGEHT